MIFQELCGYYLFSFCFLIFFLVRLMGKYWLHFFFSFSFFSPFNDIFGFDMIKLNWVFGGEIDSTLFEGMF